MLTTTGWLVLLRGGSMQHPEDDLQRHSSMFDGEGAGGRQGHHHQRRQTHPRKSIVVMNMAEQHRLRQVRLGTHTPICIRYVCMYTPTTACWWIVAELPLTTLILQKWDGTYVHATVGGSLRSALFLRYAVLFVSSCLYC